MPQAVRVGKGKPFIKKRNRFPQITLGFTSKKCPLLKKKCIVEKCAFMIIRPRLDKWTSYNCAILKIADNLEVKK